jgi:hypothetical protein
MSSNLHILQNKNCHPRDLFVKFYHRGHKYEVKHDNKSSYTSVTTWVHHHFPKFDADDIISKMFNSKSWGPEHKYWGMDADQIKQLWKSNGSQATTSGTNLHSKIEEFMNSDCFENDVYSLKELAELYHEENDTSDCIEWEYFIQFVDDNPHLYPYRTEWMIYDEDLKIAGSIDMVFENLDGTLTIYDWKRCKEIIKTNNWNKTACNPLIDHLPDSNFWHYSIQLNTYKSILERKYGKRVTNLYLVRLHPDAESYELMDVPILVEEMNSLFGQRMEEINGN